MKRCILFLFYFENANVKEEYIHFIPSQIWSHLLAIHSFNFQLDVELPYILHLTSILVLIERMLRDQLHTRPTYSRSISA